jgi:hypothetical protein
MYALSLSTTPVASLAAAALTGLTVTAAAATTPPADFNSDRRVTIEPMAVCSMSKAPPLSQVVADNEAALHDEQNAL